MLGHLKALCPALHSLWPAGQLKGCLLQDGKQARAAPNGSAGLMTSSQGMSSLAPAQRVWCRSDLLRSDLTFTRHCWACLRLLGRLPSLHAAARCVPRHELGSGCDEAVDPVGVAPGALQGVPHAALRVLSVHLSTHLEPSPLLRAGEAPQGLQQHDFLQLEPGFRRHGELQAAGQPGAHGQHGSLQALQHWRAYDQHGQAQAALLWAKDGRHGWLQAAQHWAVCEHHVRVLASPELRGQLWSLLH